VLPSGRCNTFDGANRCSIEWDEWVLVQALVSPSSTVLELGARYGTTSCVLARATGNSGNVVSVEPDARAHADLRRNRDAHACNFHIVRGTVSKHRLAQGRGGSYETRTRLAGHNETGLDNFALNELERWIGSRFNTLLIDCEGCIKYVSDELFQRVDLLLLEEDESGPIHVDYTQQGSRLANFGFQRFWRHHGSVRSGLPVGFHSAWRKATSQLTASLPGCTEYASRMQYSKDFLHCADP
jgi:FkbM family methyltransferase